MASNKYNPFGKPSAEKKAGPYTHAVKFKAFVDATVKSEKAWQVADARARTKTPYAVGNGPKNTWAKQPAFKYRELGALSNKPKRK